MTVAASPVSPGGAPTAAVSNVEGHKHVLFGIPSGLKGDTGASFTGAAFDGDDIVLTKDDATTVTLENAVPALTGPQGVKGDAGVMVYSGTAITGTSTTPTTYATGITLAYVGDRYHYNGTVDAQRGNVYKCTFGGDADTALWVYDGNIRGVSGSGSVSTVNGISPDGNGDVPLGAIRYNAAQPELTDAEKAQARSNAGAASTELFTAVLPIAGWAGSGPYTQTVNVAGMLNEDNPIVDIVLSETAATAIAQLAAYGLVGRIDAGNGTITAICYEEKPAIDLTLMMKAVR
jgi:predicted small secreted protein